MVIRSETVYYNLGNHQVILLEWTYWRTVLKILAC